MSKWTLLIAMSAVLLPKPSLAEISGSVVMTDGTVYDALRISCLRGIGTEREDNIRVSPPDHSYVVEVPAQEVTAINISTVNRRAFSCHGTRCDYSFHISEGSVELSSDRIAYLTPKATLELVRYRNYRKAPSPTCKITIQDSFTSTAQEISLPLVGDDARVARFSLEGVGVYRWSESSQTAFPPNFFFDPYTGERTVPKPEE